jgi:hypothetical protein
MQMRNELAVWNRQESKARIDLQAQVSALFIQHQATIALL